MNRIFISGAHGVGKSTLAKVLAEKLGWELKTEAARSVIEKMGNPKYMDFTTKILFQEEVRKAQAKNEDDDGIGVGMVIDRSALDISAYLELFYNNESYITEKDFKDYANLRLNILSDFWIGDRELLVILPLLGTKPEDDGVRFLDQQKEFHELLMNDYWKQCSVQDSLRDRTLIIATPGTTEEYSKMVINKLLMK